MRLLKNFLILELLFMLTSCLYCLNNDAHYTYIDVYSIQAEFFSTSNRFNDPVGSKNDIGLVLNPDSIAENILISSNNYFLPVLTACDDNKETFYNQTIDSLTVFTRYKINEFYEPGAVINALLSIRSFRSRELLTQQYAFEASGDSFELLSSPESDSVQFIVSGRISNGIEFSDTTQLLVFN